MKRFLITFSFALTSFYWVNAITPQVEMYVSTKGKDTNSGKKNAPLKTINNAVKMLAASNKTTVFDQAIIWLEDGIYPQTETINVNPELFGGKNMKITIATLGKGKAQLSSGKQIPSSLFKKVNNPELNTRLNANAIGKLYAAELKGTGIESAFSQNLDENVEWNERKDNYSMVSWNQYLLKIAQWPNRGYNHLLEVIDKGPTTRWLKPGESPMEYSRENPTGAKFKMVENADWTKWNAEFSRSNDMIMEGFPSNDWYFQTERVGKLNNDLIQLLHHTRYGIEINQKMMPRRVRFLNLLCELDEPGEWYFDNKTKTFYIYPIEPITSKTHITIIAGSKMFQIDKMKNFTLKNIILENGGDLAVEMNQCDSSLIAGCVFRNFTGRGFNINGGIANGVVGSDLYGLHSAGSMSGGDRKTLTPCYHYMDNNNIYDCRLRGYGVVGLNGVGIRFAHNLMYDMNGAVMYSGSDIVLEYNEFYNMGWEMGDWNVAYIGGDWASWGNEVRYNFVHHLMEMPGAYPVEAFRNDDLGQGVSFHGNIFYKSGRGCVAFSGAGNSCYSNISVETPTVYQAHLASMEPIEIRKRWEELKQYDSGELKRGNKEDYFWRAEQIYGKFGWCFEPYLSRFPKLKQVMNEGNPWAPTYSVIKRNYVDKKEVEKGFYTHRGSVKDFPKTCEWEFPKYIEVSQAFVDPSVLNFKLKPEVKLMEGFESADFNKIGLYIDEYRKSAPDKNTYRKKIKDQLNGIPSAGGKYNMEEAYKRYPIPAYLK